MTLQAPPEIDNARPLLEFDAVIDAILTHAVSEPGAARLRSLPWLPDGASVDSELGRVTEARDVLSYDDPFPLKAFPDCSVLLKKAAVSGAFLDGPQILSIHGLLLLSRHVLRYFEIRTGKYPGLALSLKPLAALEDLEHGILDVLEPTGEVRDRASPLLGRLRRELGRKRDVMRRRLEHLLRAMVRAGYAQEESLTLRQGRLVIPMKETHSGRLKGVVVDESASGATVFVEPLEALETGNEIRRLESQERQEVERLLKALTARVASEAEAIRTNQGALADLDSVAARARHGLSVSGNAAATAVDGVLELKNARHPLLLLKHSLRDVVPLNLTLGGGLRTLVITGPNAGGKTVALKTVGLLALMHQHGLLVPADEGTRLPAFEAVYADIGDRQSIEEDLSTFSSHVQNLKHVLGGSGSGSLVLLDEIGASTDPSEGGALAMAILRSLTGRRALTVATTHIGLLKVFAQDTPGVENGSMVFDQDTLKPTYRFRMGIPGSSYAFEIAGKYGFPESVISEARAFLGGDRGRLDGLIASLEEKVRGAESLHREAAEREARAAALERYHETRLAAIDDEAASIRERRIAEAETLFREAQALKERVLKEIRESGGAAETVKRLNEELKAGTAAVKTLAALKKADRRATALRAGDWVVWRGHTGAGRVAEAADRNGRVLVEWNDVRVRIEARSLEPVAPPSGPRKSAGFVNLDYEKPSNNEVDLRGKTADEAVAALERYLGDASAAGFASARVIHGKGTGVLRREVRKYLETHPLVKSLRSGAWNEGDTGVTVVELK